MVVYPVIIPTLCRYLHFKNCVESLSRCTLADSTELVIGLDYPSRKEHYKGNEQIRQYLKNIRGFKKVTIFDTNVNLGALKNIKRLKDYVYNTYNAVIVSEDDNVFSPCFLEFMNKALNEFEDNLDITSVCGYNGFGFDRITDNKLILTYQSISWGVGYWKNKAIDMDNGYYIEVLSSIKKTWKLFFTYPTLIRSLIVMFANKDSYGDMKISTYNVVNKKYQVRPNFSMVRNMGQDGSGLHSGVDLVFHKQEIQKSEHFDFDRNAINIAFKEVKRNNNYFRYLNLLSNNKLLICPKLIFYILSLGVFNLKRCCCKKARLSYM